MKFFKIPTADKFNNFVITVFTAFFSTFFLQSCDVL